MTTTASGPGGSTRVAVALRDTFRGQLITPAAADYDTARALWNGAIDRRPALIARCADAVDVTAALRARRLGASRCGVGAGGPGGSPGR